MKTNLTELNRLYGEYANEAGRDQPNGITVLKSWFAYTSYLKRYNSERGLETPLTDLAHTRVEP